MEDRRKYDSCLNGQKGRHMANSIIDTATLSDLRYLIDSAREEGWNPGLHDAIPFYFTDPSGFFIERVQNKPIGCISAVAYNHSYGFMGFYIVSPEFRKKGYGLKLWDHAISYLGDRSIGLDGVVAQQANYRKSGFNFYYNNIRYCGKVRGKKANGLAEIDTVAFPRLLDYDERVVGFNRAIFLQHWITMPQSYGLVKIEDQKVIGYGLIRKCERGYKIGPLFADNSQIAREIYLGLIEPYPGEDIVLDVIHSNDEALKLVQEHGMTKIFETARMYKKLPPPQRLENIFGVTSFELG